MRKAEIAGKTDQETRRVQTAIGIVGQIGRTPGTSVAQLGINRILSGVTPLYRNSSVSVSRPMMMTAFNARNISAFAPRIALSENRRRSQKTGHHQNVGIKVVHDQG